MIDNKSLKSLIKLMVENDLTELDLQDPQGERVTIKRRQGEPQAAYVPQAPATAPAPAAVGAPAGTAAADEGLIAISSPMVGTFYAAPSPGAKDFVSVGDSVDAEKVICLIEAMKVFNEIKAEVAGTIERILLTNGKAVEYGQPLFMIRPQ
ncbi:MAG: acetyl-CoA carboxylase biotin carboxyl carrier protein [Phycisphaeraceae bacterium]